MSSAADDLHDLFAPSPYALGSPVLPDLSLLLDDLEGSAAQELEPQMLSDTGLNTLSGPWGQQSNGSSTSDTSSNDSQQEQLQLLHSLLQRMEQLVGSQLQRGGGAQPMQHTLTQLHELVSRQHGPPQAAVAAAAVSGGSPPAVVPTASPLSGAAAASAAFPVELSPGGRSLSSSAARLPPLIPPAVACHPAMSMSDPPAAVSAPAAAAEDEASKPRGSKRVHRRNQRFGELESVLEEKRSQAAALEAQNRELRRRQRLLDTFIQARDSQLFEWGQLAAAVNSGRWINPWLDQPVFGSVTIEKMQSMDEAGAMSMITLLLKEAARLLLLMGRTSGGRRQSGADSTGTAVSLQRPPVSTAASLLMRSPVTTGNVQGDIPMAMPGVAATGWGQPAHQPADLQVLTWGEPSSHRLAVSARKQLEALMQCMHQMGKCMQYMNPQLANCMAAASLRAGKLPPEAWQQVLHSCSLNEEQICDTLMMDQLCCQLSAEIQQERRHLVSVLSDQIGRWQMSSKLTTDMHMEVENASCLDLLQKNMMRERRLNFLAMEVFFNHILDVEQMAEVLVTCFPRVQNKLGIVQQFVEQLKMSRMTMGI